MEQTEYSNLVAGVRFSRVGKIYHFLANDIPDLQMGDMVVVETSRGWQLGQVAQILRDPKTTPDGGWKSVDRRATPRDLLLRQGWQSKEAEVITICRDRANQLYLTGIKIIGAEYSFDGTRLAVLFSSETEEKYDLKSLRGDMQRAFAPAQVEMRQIGPRDVAKTLCGMGACGLEQRCCSKFLTEFNSISIRMAKEQGISLTPTEITGMCGRLRCCLIYEYEQYVQARALLPKRNKRVLTPKGEGRVLDVSPIRQMVLVELPEDGRREFASDEIRVLEEGEVVPPQPPAKPIVEAPQPRTQPEASPKPTADVNGGQSSRQGQGRRPEFHGVAGKGRPSEPAKPQPSKNQPDNRQHSGGQNQSQGKNRPKGQRPPRRNQTGDLPEESGSKDE